MSEENFEISRGSISLSKKVKNLTGRIADMRFYIPTQQIKQLMKCMKTIESA